jgi:ABC-type dipeptide/oligopeptide/nickel transport system ATPase component
MKGCSMKKSNIVLIGMSGAGKSTVGIALSFKMRMPFVDMDNYIERTQKMTISKIFETRGNEYFFFSRIEPKATLEQKIMRAYYWIDVLDFFKTYDETFGPGFRFQPEQILVETNINMLLQNKLDGMRKHFSDKDIRKEVLENMIRQLTKDSFLEQENEKTNTYKVMSAWHYLERLIESINIYDETEDEKPE